MKSRDGARGVTLSFAVLALLVGSSVQADGLLRTVALSGQPAPNLPPAAGTVQFFSFSSPGLNDAGRAYFQSTDYLGSGYRTAKWAEMPGTGLSLVGAKGVPIPGTTALMDDPNGLTFGSENDQLHFIAYAILPPDMRTRNTAIWSNPPGESLKLIAVKGMHPPGVPTNAVFGPVIRDPVVNNNGHAAFSSDISGPGIFDAAGNRWCIWTTDTNGSLTLVARDGEHPVGMPADALFGNAVMNWQIQIDDQNEVYFSNDITSSAYTGRAVFRYRASDGVSLVFKNGDPAPGLLPGIQIGGIGFQLGRGGGVAIRTGLTGPGVNVTNDSAIFAGGTPGNLQLIAREGQAVPDLPGHVFFSLGVHAINRSGAVLIGAEHTGGPISPTTGFPDGDSQTDLWRFDAANGLNLVARDGEQAPGAPLGTEFHSFTQQTINDQGQVAFLAKLTGSGVTTSNDMGVWAEDLSGILRLVVREGDTIDVDDGPGEDFRKISSLAVTLGGPYAENDGFNNRGQFAFLASFGSGVSSGVFISDLAAIPEPGTRSMILACVAVILMLKARDRRLRFT